MTEENILQSMEVVQAKYTRDQIYEKALDYIDVKKMIDEGKKGRPLTFGEIESSFAYAGFMVGYETALRSIEPIEKGGAQNG